MTEILPEIVYSLCFGACLACVVLLFRAYLATRVRLLFWSACCFLLLAGNAALVILDLLVLPKVDLSVARVLLSLGAVSVLLFGFVWDLGEDGR